MTDLVTKTARAMHPSYDGSNPLLQQIAEEVARNAIAAVLTHMQETAHLYPTAKDWIDATCRECGIEVEEAA